LPVGSSEQVISNDNNCDLYVGVALSKLSLMVTIVTCMWELPSLNLGWEADYLDRFLFMVLLSLSSMLKRETTGTSKTLVNL
jgi:hypothetical protein